MWVSDIPFVTDHRKGHKSVLGHFELFTDSESVVSKLSDDV